MPIIGKAKNPKFFCSSAPAVPYLFKTMRNPIHKHFEGGFLMQLFLKYAEKRLKTLFLLMDECGPHGSDLVELKGKLRF